MRGATKGLTNFQKGNDEGSVMLPCGSGGVGELAGNGEPCLRVAHKHPGSSCFSPSGQNNGKEIEKLGCVSSLLCPCFPHQQSAFSLKRKQQRIGGGGAVRLLPLSDCSLERQTPFPPVLTASCILRYQVIVRGHLRSNRTATNNARSGNAACSLATDVPATSFLFRFFLTWQTRTSKNRRGCPSKRRGALCLCLRVFRIVCYYVSF